MIILFGEDNYVLQDHLTENLSPVILHYILNEAKKIDEKRKKRRNERNTVLLDHYLNTNGYQYLNSTVPHSTENTVISPNIPKRKPKSKKQNKRNFKNN